MKNKLILIFVCQFLCYPLWGEALSLEQVKEEAIQANHDLGIARAKLEVLRGRAIASRAMPNPDLEFEVGEIPFSGSGDSSKEIGVEQTFPMGGKRSLQSKVAQLELKVGEANYEVQVLDTLKEVKETYWNLSLSQEKINLSRENLQFQQRFLARVQDRFQSGQATFADVARARLEVAQASNDLLVAQTNFEIAESDLDHLIGHTPHDHPITPSPLIEDFIELNKSGLIQEALITRPERKANEVLTRAMELESKVVSRRLWTPDIKAGLLYQSGERGDGRDSWGGRLGVAVPLWYRYKGERVSARSRINVLNLEAEDLEHVIVLEVRQAYLRAKQAIEQVKLWKQAVDQATEASRLFEQQYLEGDVDILVFLQTRRELINVTREYFTALRDHNLSLASLERAVGKDLREDK